MVHHIVLFKLKPEVTPARIEEMMMNTRMQLLKIPEVLSIKCGKRIDPEIPWPFFIAIDFESMDKFNIFREDPIQVKFMEEIIKPSTADSLSLDFAMDPSKDMRFSRWGKTEGEKADGGLTLGLEEISSRRVATAFRWYNRRSLDPSVIRNQHFTIKT